MRLIRRLNFKRRGVLSLVCFVIFCLMWLAWINSKVEKGAGDGPRNLNNADRDWVMLNFPGDGVDVLPSRLELLQMSHRDLANLYHNYIGTVQTECDDVVRMGNLGDGGWFICNDEIYRPKDPCLVYSFGVGDDFSFEDSILHQYHCEIHSFDPSMTMPEGKRDDEVWFHNYGLADFTGNFNNGWKMNTLSSIKTQLNHSSREIDILKVDIEEWEWNALPNMMKTGVINTARQIAIEIHISIGPEPLKIKYLKSLLVLKDFYQAGFQTVLSIQNHWCDFFSQFSDEKRVGCHNLLYVRVK
ncbi:hypothetical protein ScPMuIL_005657 [Solemya velum]